MSTESLLKDLALIEDVAESTEGLHTSWFREFVKEADSIVKLSGEARVDGFKDWTDRLELEYRVTNNKIKTKYDNPIPIHVAKSHSPGGNMMALTHPNFGTIDVRYGARSFGAIEFKYEPMPDTYRSAKSVILKAITNDVALVDVEGNAVGKSELAEASRKAKEKRVDPRAYIRAKVKALVNEANELAVDKDTLLTMIGAEYGEF